VLLHTDSTAVQPSPIPYWPNLCSFQDYLYIWKWDLLFNRRVLCFCVAPHLLHHNFALVYPGSCSIQVKAFVFYKHYMRSLYYNEWHPCKVCTEYLSSAVGCAITYCKTPKWRLVTLTVLDLTTTKIIRCCRHIFTKQLTNNDLLSSFHYSGIQAIMSQHVKHFFMKAHFLFRSANI
jgi:hypothetical protein